MNLKDLRGQTAVVGVGTFGCGEAQGYTEMELLARSAQQAVRDAGLSMKDIDGVCTASVSSAMWGLAVPEYLGLNARFIDSTKIGRAHV